MAEKSQVRIYRREESRAELDGNGLEFFRNSVPIIHPFRKISLRTVADVRSIRLEVRSKKRKAFAYVSKDGFIGMKGESEFGHEKRSNFRNARCEKFAIRMNQYEIVHVPSVMPNPQSALYVFVERVHVEIGEYLARKISYGKSNSFRSGEKALVFRKSKPIFAFSAYDAIPRRIVAENFPYKIPERIRVFPLIFSIDDRFNHSEQPFPID